MQNPEIYAIIVAMSGALAYIGKALINAFCRNIDRQQDLAEKQQALMAGQITTQTKTLQTLVEEGRTHGILNAAEHGQHMVGFQQITQALEKINGHRPGGGKGK